MKDKGIRLLNADEIECRIGTISEKGLSLLLYKDARADMKILDEIYGPMNWQRHHEVIGGNLYCTVSIWDENKQQWICKSDVGTESYTEKEKGQASDSFKRACVSVGIGRELYTAPFIWISASKVKIENKNGKCVTYDKFKVTSIAYDENREISELVIVNQDNKVVYSMVSKATGKVTKDNNTYSDNDNGRIVSINKELERTGVALDQVLARYGVDSIETMSDDTFKRALTGLRKTKSKVA